ncbi:MAG TPA: tripartite tricarboxylate transporter substrate binding protein [Xanthobacteraceae bacterium]|nr:tripartite tricarboxylate transporter substrate binding protein [Xanthobacteraceae bacterium]
MFRDARGSIYAGDPPRHPGVTPWIKAVGRAVAIVLCLVVFGPPLAQAYPTKPVKLIVPFAAGGPIDVMGRLVAQSLSATLGQQVVVDNRPGASGAIGTRAAAAAEPDGHTLLIGSVTTLATGPLLARNLGYDPLKDFAPIALLASTPFALVVSPSVPAATPQDFIAFARANPGKLNFGTPIGTLSHLTGELFRIKTGIDFVVIPYKGAATAVTDILAGQVDMTFEPTSVLVTHINDGKVRPLAITNATRSPQLPDVPTLIESGVAGFTSHSWTGILAPAGTPAAVVSKLNIAINDGLKSPDMSASLQRLGADAKGGSPQDFAAFIGEETRKWGAIVRSSGVKLD